MPKDSIDVVQVEFTKLKVSYNGDSQTDEGKKKWKQRSMRECVVLVSYLKKKN